MLLGALAASGALLIHGLYDFNLHIPSNALLFAVLLGLLASGADSAALTWSSRRVFPVAATAIAVVVVWFAIAASDIGESRRITREIDPVLITADEFTASIQRVVRSRRTVAKNPETAHLLGRLYNEEAYRSKDAARYRDIRLDQAAGAFREAMKLAPARGLYWFELGWTEANRGNDETADVLFTRAFELEPQHSPMLANHASYLASRGRIDEALEQLERGRALVPGIRSIEAVSILAPFVGDDPIVLQRAAGVGVEGDAALAKYLTERAAR
jgi:tetratricopeptide (TPR) repeat protein